MLKPFLRRHAGFTVVELVIVVIVVGVLASMTVITYNVVNRNATESSVKSDLRQAQAVITMLATRNVGQYPTSLSTADINASNGNNFAYTVNNASTPPTYCLVATDRTGRVSFYITHTQKIPMQGAC